MGQYVIDNSRDVILDTLGAVPGLKIGYEHDSNRSLVRFDIDIKVESRFFRTGTMSIYNIPNDEIFVLELGDSDLKYEVNNSLTQVNPPVLSPSLGAPQYSFIRGSLVLNSPYIGMMLDYINTGLKDELNLSYTIPKAKFISAITYMEDRFDNGYRGIKTGSLNMRDIFLGHNDNEIYLTAFTAPLEWYSRKVYKYEQSQVLANELKRGIETLVDSTNQIDKLCRLALRHLVISTGLGIKL